MPFVLENIDTPAKQAIADSFAARSPYFRGIDQKLWFDRENRLYFANLGGGALDVPYRLVLAAEGGEVLVEAQGLESGSGLHRPKSIDIVWDIEKITIAKSSKDHAEHLIARFREALDAYGSSGNAEVTRSVRANFPTPTFR